MNVKQKSNIFLILVVFLLVVVGVFVFHRHAGEMESSGSVNQINPVNTHTANPTQTGWKIFTDKNQGITFMYPENILTKYIHAVDWPPKVAVNTEKFICQEIGKAVLNTPMSVKKTIGDRVYCVTEKSEGAAGSIYTDHTYQTALGEKLVSLMFTTRAVQCDNYDDPEKTTCKNERAAFNTDKIADQIIQTVKFI